MAVETEQLEDNPLLEGLRVGRTPEPCVLVIFGASGDLTKRKIFPALYALAYRRLLPEQFGVVGVARSELIDEQFVEKMERAVREFGRDEFRDDVWQRLAEATRYIAADIADAESLERLDRCLASLDEERGTRGNRLYYLAIPPEMFPAVVRERGKRRKEGPGWERLIVEKPFGWDLASARELSAQLSTYFREEEVFRIDHYLGKETVQNMLALRFANGIFEPIWNRQFIDHVQITVAESMGIEGRALRAGGRDPRHLPEPPPAAARDHGHGAADRLHGRLGAEREGEGAALAAHARPEARRARAVRARLRRRCRSARLP
jgi:glucose-6-phosphate 1-dehydrogenase